MDWSATCKIETAELVDPPTWVPGPTGDGVVDDRAPDEHEDNARQHAAAFSYGADGEGHAGINVRCPHSILKGAVVGLT